MRPLAVRGAISKMANTKTAKKQIQISKRNHERNLAVKSKLKTMMKRARVAITAADDQAAAAEAVNNAVKTLYKSATKGIIKKQNASRRVSRLMLSFNKAFAEGAVRPEAPAKKTAAKAPAKPKAIKATVAAPAAVEAPAEVEAPVAEQAAETPEAATAEEAAAETSSEESN
jgi:small subunit ribosomal protein S20